MAAERRGLPYAPVVAVAGRRAQPEALAGVLGDARSERAAVNLELEARP
jgi:hypothetical protein